MIKDFRNRLTSLIKKEETFILLLSVVCVLFILSITNTLRPGKLAKVDFVSFENFSNWSPGWSPDNFGKGIGLGNSVIYYTKLVSLLPAFPFAGVIYFYLIPISLVGISFFNWIKFLFDQKKGNPKSSLIAAYSIFYLTNSIIFTGVFLYGWNLLTLLPLSGLALTCYGIDKFVKNEKSKNLLIIAVGACLIGGMIQFLIFPILY